MPVKLLRPERPTAQSDASGAVKRLDDLVEPTNSAAGDRSAAWVAPGRRFAIVLIAAIVAGVLTYVVSGRVTPTFSSSAELRVVVGGTSGLGQDSLLASNDLTAQFVQLVPTNAVLQAPAAGLGLSVSALQSAISVGSVAQENLLQISAQASSAAESQRIAATVARDFMTFETSDSRALAARSSAVLSSSIRSLAGRLGQISSQLRTATGGQAVLLQSEYNSTLTQSQALSTQSAEHAAAGVPTIEQVQSAGLGSQVAPRPKIYAIVAALVAAFIAVQFFVVTDRGRRSRLA